METKIKELKQQFEKDLDTTKNLDELYLKYFSKKHGLLTALLKELPKLKKEDKVEFGPQLNKLKRELEEKIEGAQKTVKEKETHDPLIDLTYPLPAKKRGMLHPTTQVIREMNEFFRYYGFSIVEGPEIETAEYNFRKLNLPEGHPATDLQDTLFIKEPDILLRTHTSSIEARLLTEQKPPIRVAMPGKCYRNETTNLTNGSYFWQYQGVVVDKGITIQHLKGVLKLFHQFLFQDDDIKLRFRYKYYPEVSPGMGVDVQCKFCEGKGCDVCGTKGWVEVLGSGMIHYNTLKACNIDPDKYTGFAFGMGIDRLVMQKFGISDIRKLYGGKLAYK
jgi:phenylalanyl-tRNA synthetase alpha chain